MLWNNSIGGRREWAAKPGTGSCGPRIALMSCLFSIAIFLVFILMLVKSFSICTWRDCATSQAQFVLGKKVSIIWSLNPYLVTLSRQVASDYMVPVWTFRQYYYSRELCPSPIILWLWCNAVMSTICQPAGTYRLLEDQLLSESRKRKLSDELIPSGCCYLHQWMWRKKQVIDSQQQPSRHWQRDRRKK